MKTKTLAEAIKSYIDARIKGEDEESIEQAERDLMSIAELIDVMNSTKEIIQYTGRVTSYDHGNMFVDGQPLSSLLGLLLLDRYRFPRLAVEGRSLVGRSVYLRLEIEEEGEIQN